MVTTAKEHADTNTSECMRQLIGTELLSPEETASVLGLSAETLSTWRSRKKHLSFIKLGGKVKYKAADILALLEGARHAI